MLYPKIFPSVAFKGSSYMLCDIICTCKKIRFDKIEIIQN